MPCARHLKKEKTPLLGANRCLSVPSGREKGALLVPEISHPASPASPQRGWTGRLLLGSQPGLSLLAHSSQMVAQPHVLRDCKTVPSGSHPVFNPSCVQTVCSDPAFISGQGCRIRELAAEGKIRDVYSFFPTHRAS